MQVHEFSNDYFDKLKNKVIEKFKINEKEVAYLIFKGTVHNQAYNTAKERINILYKNGEIGITTYLSMKNNAKFGYAEGIVSQSPHSAATANNVHIMTLREAITSSLNTKANRSANQLIQDVESIGFEFKDVDAQASITSQLKTMFDNNEVDRIKAIHESTSEVFVYQNMA